MDDNKKNRDDQFEAAFPLPLDEKHRTAKIVHGPKAHETAADIIRKRVDAAYKEGDGAADSVNIEKLNDHLEHSEHQKFIYELTSSGKSLHEVQEAWHEYYAGLNEAEKHEVWQEFYNTHGKAAGLNEEAILSTQPQKPLTAPSKPLRQLRNKVEKHLPATKTTTKKRVSPLHSVAFGLGSGMIVLLIFLFSFFNERFVAPFIQPSRNVSSTPIISGAAVGNSPEIVIPKINVEIPVVYNVSTINETDIENALEGGVVHYADTALPGQDGNGVIVGHSSNNIFNPGKYKFAFVLLSRLDTGDTFYLQKEGKRYTYQVYKKQIVSPANVDVLGAQDKPATFTLITCDPPGTSTNRLVVVGAQIDPDPSANIAQSTTNKLATSSAHIPGNAPTLWSRLVKWIGN